MMVEETMEDFKKFFSTYGGGIIGAIIAIVILCTKLYAVALWIVLIFLGIWVGNYIQHNKAQVKESMKRFIDKL